MSQLLILSLKLSKTQIPYVKRGGGGSVFQLLMLSPKLPETQIPYVKWGGGGGGGGKTVWNSNSLCPGGQYRNF